MEADEQVYWSATTGKIHKRIDCAVLLRAKIPTTPAPMSLVGHCPKCKKCFAET